MAPEGSYFSNSLVDVSHTPGLGLVLTQSSRFARHMIHPGLLLPNSQILPALLLVPHCCLDQNRIKLRKMGESSFFRYLDFPIKRGNLTKKDGVSRSEAGK